MERKGQTSDNGQHNTLLIGHRPNIPGQTAPDSVTIEPELQTPSGEQFFEVQKIFIYTKLLIF